MLYEIKIKVGKEDEKGHLKEVKEHYILDAETHGEAEEIGYKLYGDNPHAKIDVFAVSRSQIREIVNNKEEDKPFFMAVVTQLYIDETTEKEKELKYPMLVCAKDLTEANIFMVQYLKQGYTDMRLDAIKRTKILDYIPYE